MPTEWLVPGNIQAGEARAFRKGEQEANCISFLEGLGFIPLPRPRKTWSPLSTKPSFFLSCKSPTVRERKSKQAQV